MTDVEKQITIAACARQLSARGDEVSRPALSRYCDRHQLKRTTPDGSRVLFSEVQAHRAKNYQREVMSGGVEVPEPAAQPARPAAVAAPAVPSASGSGEIVDLSPARRLKELQVEEQELKNARQRDEVVLADEVTAGTADVIVTLRQTLFQAVPDAAQSMAAELSLSPDEERIVRAGIKSMLRDGLARFVSEAAAANAELVRDAPGKVRHRLGQLALASAILRKRPDRQLRILRDRAQ